MKVQWSAAVRQSFLGHLDAGRVVRFAEAASGDIVEGLEGQLLRGWDGR